MKSFAEQLRDSIESDDELDRLTQFFRQNPRASTTTTLPYATARKLGFTTTFSQVHGVCVSLPARSQYGDH